MNYHRFTRPDGTTECFVNLDAVIAATPSGEDRINLIGGSLSIQVDAAQFEKAVSKKDSPEDRLGPLVGRLIQALDRLSVRIPTSIRLHM